MADHKHGDTTGWDASQVRRAQPPQQQRRRRRRRASPLAVIIKLILHILYVLHVSALLYGNGRHHFSDFCAVKRPDTEVTIEVDAEDTVQTISEKLKEAGLIDYPWFFRLYSGFSHA